MNLNILTKNDRIILARGIRTSGTAYVKAHKRKRRYFHTTEAAVRARWAAIEVEIRRLRKEIEMRGALPMDRRMCKATLGMLAEAVTP